MNTDFKNKFSFLQQVLEGDDVGSGSESDLTTHMPKKDARIVPSEVTDAKDVQDALTSAAEEEEVETVTFGLEDESENIVKVFVNVTDAEGFEEALSKALGEDESIEDILDELSKEFDIVNVIWPEDNDPTGDEDFEDAEGDEGADGDTSTDGSESLNPAVNYDDTKPQKPGRPVRTVGESLTDLFRNRLGEAGPDVATTTALKPSLDGMDPDADALEKKYGHNKYIHFAIEVIKSMGIPAQTIEFMLRRQPALAREMRDHSMGLGIANMRRLASILQIDMNGDAPGMGMFEPPAEKVDECACQEISAAEGDDETMKMDASPEDKAVESGWSFEHNKDGLHMTYNEEFRFEFNYDEMLTLLTGLEKGEKVSFDSEEGAYITFIPKEDGYVVSSSQSDQDFPLDADTLASVIALV